MKNKSINILGIVALVVTLAAPVIAFAQAISTQLVRVQAEVTTGDVTAFFEKSVTVEGVTYKQPWESVSWNASAKTVTAGGRTLTYSEVMQLVAAIAAQEKAEADAAKANPPPANP